MELIRPFEKLGKDNADLAGGKGASLGEMTNAGIPVPPGFVVLSASFERFLEETDLNVEIDAILHKVNHKEIHTVEGASESIRELILNAEMPKDIADEIDKQFKILNTQYVAVRSSATAEDGKDHAWAGQLESYLNTTEDDVLNKVKLCWSSLFTPRAIFYRFEKGLHTTKISVAVVIQKMVESEVSGIAFSVHPVTEDYNQLIIEAGFGLGEAIVSGSVTPDSYVVSKEPRAILDINISTQDRALYRSETVSIEHGHNEWIIIPEPRASSQVLSESQILELSEIILTIENHYGFPCDIEWAYEGGKFYVVQSRPITTLAVVSVKKEETPLFRVSSMWSKNWEAAFSLLATDIGLKAYTTFEKEFGTPLSPIISHTQGITACYYADNELDRFTNRIWELYKTNPQILENWIREAERACDTLADLVKKENPLLVFSEFNTCVDMFGAPAFAIKEITNRFDSETKSAEMQKVTDFRKYTELFYFNTDIFLKKIISVISEKSGYRTQLIESLTLPELSRYLEDSSLPEEATLKDRYERSVAWYINNIFTYYSGDIDEVFAILYGQYDGSGNIKGVKAYGGKVQGIVKNITSYDSLISIDEETILVTGMTDPRFIHLMYTAKAFVTDAGGMLSHAAIVSRELKKPCVVGTKIATQVLKDGDLVEVDADNGVVRILEKAENKNSFLNELDRDDFVLTYESQGSDFLFEDMDSHFYRQWESLSCWRNGRVQVFTRKSVMEQLSKEGLSRTPEETREVIKSLDKLIREASKKASTLGETISLDDARSAYSLIKEIFTTYSYFEAAYWDALYELSSSDVDAKENIKIVQEYKNIVREKLNDLFFEPESYLALLTRAVGKTGGISPRDAQWYQVEELFNLLQGEKVSQDVLDIRHKTFIFYKDTVGNVHLVSDREADIFIDTFAQVDESQKKIIKGKTASGKGVVCAKAFIITRDYSDVASMNESMSQMPEGAVLITETTDPAMMPAMQKASAIITDVGGMLSHAAISARELGVPCIIETQNATRMIQDGDLVEVDADNGVVRILEKGNESTVKVIKATDWHSDWSGPFSLFGLSLPTSTYFDGMEKYFGKGIDRVFVAYKKGIAFSRLPDDQYYELGVYLTKKAQDKEYVKKWATQFKKVADTVIQAMPSTPEEYIKKLPELIPLYQAYGAHNVATKVVFDVGFDQLSEETKDLLEDARKYSETFYKDDSQILGKAIDYISKITGYPQEEISMLMYDEFNLYLKQGVLPSHDILKNRWISSGIYFTKNETIVLSSKELEQIEESRMEDAHDKEISGQVAYRGKVQGRCRIVLDFKDATFEKGEVLVTGMTDPDFVSLMEKAVAIVTDGGGMLSHAAIVARELKKPCVIGTKFATQVLKDGDLVEVDADNGVVRILESLQKTFEKIYTRDTTYIMQEIWAYGCSGGVEKEFGWKNQYLPGIIHHMNQGSIEIWENIESTRWLMDAVLKRNIESPEFIDEVLKKYKEKLSVIHKLWEKKTLPIEELQNLVELSREAITYFIPYYYSAVDDRTPKDVREKALEMRNKDEFFAENDMILRDSLTDIYPQIKGYETTVFFDELGAIPDMDLLRERRESSFVIQGKEKFVGTLNGFNKVHKNFVFKKDLVGGADIFEIKGEIAQKGKVVGRVRIVRRRDQIGDVTEENVIVSPMTTPDFMPAMKKAKAFVTDEGGITCHAAIVSRELKIPCIIGTKFATQVLKDGDLVEVDADNGVVRILEKAK